MWFFYLWISLTGLVFPSAAAHANGKVSFFHSLKGDIRQEWDDKNKECLTQLLSIIDGVQNFTLGGTWIWDSMQLPNGVLYGSQYHLGNYDQCLKAPQGQNGVRTKYCLADVTLVDDNLVKRDRNFNPNDSTEKYLTTLLKCGLPLNVLTWGVCVPSSCDNDSVAKFLKVMLRYSAFHAVSSPKITVESCEIAGAAKQYPTSYYLFWCFALLLITVTLLCTFYNNVIAVDAENSNYFRAKVVKAFCIKNNCHSLVKEIDGDVPCIYAIRLLAIVLAAFLHYWMYVFSGPFINGLDIDTEMTKFSNFVHVTIGIEVFFLFSGLLSMKGLMARKKNPEEVHILLLKRYIRFLGVLGILLWYFMSVFEHSGNGPIWDRLVGRELNYCTKNWPLTLLLVNNYINTDKICQIVTWNISADFQLTVFCVVLFYLCLKLKYRAARYLVISITLYALIAPGILNYWYSWPADLFFDRYQYGRDPREHPLFGVRYTKSFFHAGPYLIGMGLGYLLSVYKPSQHRNKISKEWSIVLFGTSAIIGVLIFLSGNVVAVREYNAVEAAIYAATNRNILALAIAAIILICEYGTPNMFSKLASWRAFVPFSRLTYGVYLTHPLLISFTVYSTRAPLTMGDVTVAMGAFGAIIMSFAASFIIWIFVEAPLNNLTNVLLQFRKSNVSSPVEKDSFHSNGKLVEENKIDEENKRMKLQYMYTNSESIRHRIRT